jgi:hypothetical protein
MINQQVKTFLLKGSKGVPLHVIEALGGEEI